MVQDVQSSEHVPMMETGQNLYDGGGDDDCPCGDSHNHQNYSTKTKYY